MYSQQLVQYIPIIMDTIKVYECFSVIHDICTSSNVNPKMLYDMLKRIIECKVVRGTDIATVLFDTQNDWVACLENGGYTLDEIYELHDMLNGMYYYLGTVDDAPRDDNESEEEKSEESDDSDSEYSFADSDDESEAAEECSDNNVFNMLVNQLSEDNKTNTQLAWIAGYVTATVFHKTMVKHT